jgi:ribosomal protein L29
MSKAKESITKLRDLPADELRGALARVRDELFRLQLGRTPTRSRRSPRSPASAAKSRAS